MTRSRQRAAQISELSFSLAMSKARAQNAREAARRRSQAAASRLAALEPLLAKAGYGPHGAAPRIRAEARAVAARSARSTDGTECTGPGCRVCAEGRQRDAARGDTAPYAPRAASTTYREIARYAPTPRCSGCGYVSCRCGR